jgi:hypothetical protein
VIPILKAVLLYVVFKLLFATFLSYYFNNTNKVIINYAAQDKNQNSLFDFYVETRGKVVTVSEDIHTLYAAIICESGKSFSNVVVKPQIELGTTATAYEPYKEGETITTTIADGAELNSVAPNMTIYTNTAGAVIDCTYNKDTNIVINKLTQAIINLGGSI